VYTGAFTPSFQPFPTREDTTKLQLRFDGTFDDTSPSNRVPISTVGVSFEQWNGSNSPTATSIGVVGSSRGVEYAKTADFVIGTQDATIKFRVYKSIAPSVTFDSLVGDWYFDAAVDHTWCLWVTPTGQLQLGFCNQYVQSVPTIPYNTWISIVVSMKGDVCYVFVDGTLYITCTAVGRNLSDTIHPFVVGGNNVYTDGADAKFDRFQLDIGVARYDNTHPPTKWV